MAQRKMRTIEGLYKKMGRDAFLEVAKHYSNHVKDSVEATLGEMESRWYDASHTMTEAEKMVDDYNRGLFGLVQGESLAVIDAGQTDMSIKI